MDIAGQDDLLPRRTFRGMNDVDSGNRGGVGPCSDRLLLRLTMPDSLNGDRNHKGDGAQTQQSRHLAWLPLRWDRFWSLVFVFRHIGSPIQVAGSAICLEPSPPSGA